MTLNTVHELLCHIFNYFGHLEWFEEKMINGKKVVEKLDLEALGKTKVTEFDRKYGNYKVVDLLIGMETSVIIRRP